MCRECFEGWFEGREPPPVTDAMAELAADLARYTGCSGLAVILDDWNLCDADIRHCQAADNLTDTEKSAAERLLELSEDERYVVLAAVQFPQG